jgi:hypothetical protein
VTPVRRFLGCLLAAVLATSLTVSLAPAGQAVPSADRCRHRAYAKAHPRACPPAKPRHVWSPHDASTFNYPFGRKRERYRIRHRVLAAIKGSPAGSKIRLATFTYVDKQMTTALIAAHRRGVSVQLLANRADVGKSPPYHRLRAAIGHRLFGGPGVTAADASFARTCDRSCRGVGGTLHSKIFLFSQVGRARWVSMVGSANLTMMAAEGQWNHLDTVVDRSTYVALRRVFNQMKLDRVPAKPLWRWHSAKASAWVFPHRLPTPADDPIVRVLRSIGCHAPKHTGFAVPPPKPTPRPRHRHRHKAAAGTGPSRAKPTPRPVTGAPTTPWTRRTVIRISMYAWFDARGDYLAREVRRKWNQGCDVKVLYAVLNAKVKRILYSPTGRGRNPMRRTVTTDDQGMVVDYNHSKYLAVSGAVNHAGRRVVWSGSMNFTGLGVISDDIVLRLGGRRTFRSYLTNFRRVWHSPKSRKPIPTSAFARLATGSADAPVDPRLGVGALAGLEQD